MQETQVQSWVGKIPSRRKWQLAPVFLPGKFHRQRSLGGLQSMGLQRVGHMGILVYQAPYSKWCWIPCFWHEGKRVEERLLLPKPCVMLKAISCRPSLMALNGETLHISCFPWLLRAGEPHDFFEVIFRPVVLKLGNFAPQGMFGHV